MKSFSKPFNRSRSSVNLLIVFLQIVSEFSPPSLRQGPIYLGGGFLTFFLFSEPVVFPVQTAEQSLAPVVQTPVRAGFYLCKNVRRENRESDGRIKVGHDGVVELARVDLPPCDSFAGGGAGESPGIRPGIGYLQVVVVPLFLDSQHFLDLRLRLEDG